MPPRTRSAAAPTRALQQSSERAPPHTKRFAWKLLKFGSRRPLYTPANMRTLLVLSLAAAAFGAADTSVPATCKTEADLIKALAAGAATPDMLTAEVQNTDRHRINVVRRTKAAGAVAHEGFAELHHIMDGSGTLVTGGTIVRPAGGRGSGPATI